MQYEFKIDFANTLEGEMIRKEADDIIVCICTLNEEMHLFDIEFKL